MHLQKLMWTMVSVLVSGGLGHAQSATPAFDGLDMNLGNLSRLSDAKSRSISPENFTGEKGKAGMATEGTGKNAARDLGRGWKVSPSVRIKAGSTFTLAEIDGPGAIQQIWMTPAPLDKTRHIHPPLLLGRRDGALGRSARWAISSPAAGASIARSTRCRSASTRAAPSIATGRCRSARRPRSRWRTSMTRT